MAPAADREGYWGTPTSTLEWCEENYAVSYYIAEFCEWPLRPRFLPRPWAAASHRRLLPPLRSPSCSLPTAGQSLLLLGPSFLRGDRAATPQPTPLGGKWVFCTAFPHKSVSEARAGVASVSPACGLRPHPERVPSACVHRGGRAGAGVAGACEGGWDGVAVRWVLGIITGAGWFCGTTGMGEERGFRWSCAWGATP